jgi:hypothetical protein
MVAKEPRWSCELVKIEASMPELWRRAPLRIEKDSRGSESTSSVDGLAQGRKGRR